MGGMAERTLWKMIHVPVTKKNKPHHDKHCKKSMYLCACVVLADNTIWVHGCGGLCSLAPLFVAMMRLKQPCKIYD